MNDPNLMSSLTKTAALASETYSRTLARMQLMSLHDTFGVNISQNRNVSTSDSRSSGVYYSQRPNYLHNSVRNSTCQTRSSKYRKPNKACASGHKHPVDVKPDDTDTCQINSSMKKIKEHMDMISFHCECFYDSCPSTRLSRADKRHLRSFHRGVLKVKEAATAGEASTKPGKKATSKRRKTTKKKGISKDTSSTISSDQSSLSSDNIEQSSSSDESSSSTDTPNSEEMKKLLEEAEIFVQLTSPDSDQQTFSSQEEKTAQSKETGTLSPRIPHPKHSIAFYAKNPLLRYNTKQPSNDEEDEQIKNQNKAIQIPSTIPESEDSSLEDSSLALLNAIEKQTGSAKHVWFEKPQEVDTTKNAKSMIRKRYTKTRRRLAFNLNANCHLQEISAVPAVAEKHLSKSASKEEVPRRTSPHTRACPPSKEQGIHIMTKPGKYIVKTPTGENSVFLVVNPGSFVRLNLD